MLTEDNDINLLVVLSRIAESLDKIASYCRARELIESDEWIRAPDPEDEKTNPKS